MVPPTKFKTASIHTEQLPVIGTFLDHRLTNFRMNFSPWKQPMQWIQDDKEHLHSIIQAITQLTKSNKIMQIDFIHEMIFPVYIITPPLDTSNTLHSDLCSTYLHTSCCAQITRCMVTQASVSLQCALTFM